MENVMWNSLFEYSLGLLILTVPAFISAKIARPIFLTKTSKIISQTIASILLFVELAFSKAIEKSNIINDIDNNLLEAVIIFSLIVIFKFIGMFLISSYALSVGKSRYWSFIALLNFMLAFPILIFSLWRGIKMDEQPHS